MESDADTIRCLGCGIEFNAKDVEGKEKCPVCGASLADQNKTTLNTTTASQKISKNRSVPILLFALILIGVIIVYTQLTIFVIQPLGALPEGKTLIIYRLNKTNFIDSADAMCERISGKVNLLCRGVVLGAVAKNAEILMRLPYSETLYLISTNGAKYER